ncbi:Carbohydrate-binding module family 24 protein [Pleurostoma richardsiae]|uniref:Carbohydrate-binding module family 24 protein n=1 Tax=Pleurostoma richardsiae TaxID=41990 RepID=A0AA38R8Q6_9PEZI|nr:Carbohydrate-binding module family 24 protein [Pleurostoma richardsiae]
MLASMFFAFVSTACLWAASLTQAAPASAGSLAVTKRATGDRLVFCHFMIGIVSDRTSSADYDADMQRAKSLGIDAFALNIGVDSYTDTQLGYAYDSADQNGMKVFISFDFNWYHAGSDAAAVGQMIAKYASKPAQLMVDEKVFASSFAGDGLDVTTMRSSAGTDVFWAPNFHPDQTADPSAIDAALNWMAWDNNGNNKAPTVGANVTVEDGDTSYQNWLGTKPYIAPVSAWFFTHFGPEVSYSKNWVFPGDLLWYRRWNDILSMQPRFLEIITWNDYGESHYIGPLSSKHYDDGNSKWTNDMPHDGWLDMAKPYIAAYHDGASSVDSYITTDQVVYWYRPTLRTLDCDATDTTMVTANNDSGNYFEGKPNGWESMSDSVFVVTLLTSAGNISVTSGDNTVQTFTAPAGAAAFSVPMAVGKQQFLLKRGTTTVLSGTSLKDISSECICGIYNFNAYVGTLPDGESDPLGADGLASLTAGLHVTTCQATPSLGTATGGSGSTTAPATTATATTAPASTTTPGGGATPTSKPATTTPPVTTTPTTATSSVAPSSTGTCNRGTTAAGVSDNLLGLCDFACNHGYCPAGPCVCTSYGTPAYTPETAPPGCPLDGEDDSYLGLCSFDCARGYCPSTACKSSC